MPVMPPSNTSQPLPVPSGPRLRAFRRSAQPAGGEPVKPHADAFSANQAAYAVTHVPESTVPGFDEGFSPQLRTGSEGTTPDDIRIKRREPPVHTPDARFYKRRNADFLGRRLAHETEIQNGWQIEQHRDPVPQNIPMSVEQLPRRWTATLGPNTSWFTRDDHHRNPEFTGEHFSLADHRRIYAIMGQKPQGRIGVNTFRAEPRPWDESLYTAPIMAASDSPRSSVPRGRSFRAAGTVTHG